MGGFWKEMPRMGGVALVFVMASLGLPGLGNFIAEFLTLAGAWQANKVLTVLAAIGLVAATVYSLRIAQKVFYGPLVKSNHHSLMDMSARENLIMIPLVVVIIFLGLFPQPFLKTSEDSIQSLLQKKSSAQTTLQTNDLTTGGAHDTE